MLLLSSSALQVAGLPLDDRATPWGSNNSIAPLTSVVSNLPSLVLDVSSLGDWEHFTYPIPNTKRVLKGRIFTNRPIRHYALHYMIDGGMAQATSHISAFGDTHLSFEDNPFTYRVPGCHFKMSSKLFRGRATMSYGTMREVFLALEQLLEKEERFFAVSFVLTDEKQGTWGHGEVSERAILVSPPRHHS